MAHFHIHRIIYEYQTNEGVILDIRGWNEDTGLLVLCLDFAKFWNYNSFNALNSNILEIVTMKS